MQAVPVTLEDLAEDYRRVELAIRYLEEHYREQPTLARVAAEVGLSEYHFQRMFSRWVGISPKRFLQHLTLLRAKELLERRAPLLEASYDSGLSGPGRLHDLFVRCEAVTPGEYRARGRGLTIRYGYQPTPLGDCLLAISARGIVGLSFLDGLGQDEALGQLRWRWPQALLLPDPEGTRRTAERVFLPHAGAGAPVELALSGTNFQIQVWQALLRIPCGSVVTYQDVAVAIGMPASVRAVGNAVGGNPIPVLVPCHRVIRKDGSLGGYRYGLARKRALLGRELSVADSEGAVPGLGAG
jgi:AraC family transcriptional regulator of adaptative response/methylated-DNA-[protein]-cysteine methyltransferase